MQASPSVLEENSKKFACLEREFQVNRVPRGRFYKFERNLLFVSRLSDFLNFELITSSVELPICYVDGEDYEMEDCVDLRTEVT